MKQYDLVKFGTPFDSREAELRFIIVEVRGDRLLVVQVGEKHNGGYMIPPQFVYLTSEMILA